jgi:hypothetical protein
MDIEQQLRAALVPCNPRPELRSRILARISGHAASTRGSGRGRSRTILFGTILAVAAAAATLVAGLKTEPRQPEVAAIAVAPAVEPAAAKESELPSLLPRPVAEAPPEEKPPHESVAAVTWFRVRVLPLESGDADLAAKGILETFYAAFLSNLRAVPGLSLEVESSAESAEETLPDFEFIVRGGRTADGKFMFSIAFENKSALESKRQRLKEGGNIRDGYSVNNQIVSDLSPPPAEKLAANFVEILRRRNFPEDPSLKAQLQGQLLDVSMQPVQRLKALTDLGEFKSPSGINQALRDPVTVRGAIALAGASSDPAILAQVWRTMRGSRNRELVEPVIATLRSTDGELRLQAVALLQQDFANDQQVREALEMVMLEESRPLVRALAQRAVKGEAAWEQYIVASLKDAGLSDAARMEAFLYHMYPPGPLPDSYSTGPLGRSVELLDEDVVQSLTSLLPRMAKSRESPLHLAAMMNDLSSLQKPAVTTMVLGFLEKDIDAGLKSVIIQGMLRRGNDPQVRAALEKLAVDSPDAKLRELAAKGLQALPATR